MRHLVVGMSRVCRGRFLGILDEEWQEKMIRDGDEGVKNMESESNDLLDELAAIKAGAQFDRAESSDEEECSPEI